MDVVHELQLAEYEPLGRGPDRFDCWGLVLEVCRRMGWALPPDPMRAGESPSEIKKIFGAHGHRKDWVFGPPSEGSVVFFPRLEVAFHAGIIIAGGLFDIPLRAKPRFQPVNAWHLERLEFARWAS